MRLAALALVLSVLGACAAPQLEPLSLGPAVPPAQPDLIGFDVVALVERGEDVTGLAQHEVVRGNFAYRFADAGARARFLSAPERYELAFGGGCARMGPLSGACSSTRHCVHAGRVYLAASDACLKAFQKEPEAFLEPAPEVVEPDADGARIAFATARWLGGSRKASGDLALIEDHEEKQGETLWRVRNLRVLGRAGRYVDRSDWNDSAWWNDATYSDGLGRGWARSKSSAERDLDACQLAALRREMLREPLALAREIVAGRAAARDAGRVEWQVGERSAVGRAVEIACDGVKVVWLVDEASGALLGQRGLRRLANARIGDRIELFGGWTELAGVRVPLERCNASDTESWDAVRLVKLVD
jgi:hypothetical protein